eukprot:TRINITY_DN3157_c0_g2_i10.p1 TRINITY_DN3157_c0_g2~~TRINITY_DN3157_c0_g2_i10.p1  ORF type:complete len:288 (+),score=47.02 TRINITY_DN3157_c0_g2_i10:82-864(+)
MCFRGTPSGTKEEQQRHTAIQKYLKTEEKILMSELKILLLGAGDTGKTTFCKQLAFHHSSPSPLIPTDRRSVLPVIRRNLIEGWGIVLTWSQDNTKEWPPPSLQGDAKIVVTAAETNSYIFTPEIAQAIQNLCSHEDSKKIVRKVADYLNVPGGAGGLHFFSENAMKYVNDDYEPNQDEILRIRIKTTGIIETRFVNKNHTWLVVDVGGQRNERKKWVSCFTSVDAIIFLMYLFFFHHPFSLLPTLQYSFCRYVDDEPQE